MIQEHPTWYKHHATKIEDYLTCPRYFFYRTIVGMKREDRHNHKAFGSAWHELQEQILRHGYTTEGLEIGMAAFLENYRSKWDASTDEMFSPKTPIVAMNAAALYIQRYMATDQHQEVLHIESVGAVPVRHDRLIRFKMDSILRDERGIFSREHKTGKSDGRQWIDKWLLSMQVGTYSHALHCLYPEKDVWGVEISGTMFQKTQIKFARVPCRVSLPMLNAWLVDVNRWLDKIEQDIEMLMTVDNEDAAVMQSFSRNPLSCTNYYGCEYHSFCSSWPNPLAQLEMDAMPIGFYQEYWDPEDKTEDADPADKKEDLGVLG